MADVLRLAFVGCGAVAASHLRGARALGGRIRITAAVDADRGRAESLALETGAEAFTTLDAALAAGHFDAVDLMLPHDLHEAATIAAFRAGKHVLLEKPLAPTLAACGRIMAAAKDAGTVFMVAENAQYWPEVAKVRQLLDQGAVGEVVTADAGYWARREPRWFDGSAPWRYDRMRTGGGVTMDSGTHWLRPLRIWLGEIDQVVAVFGHPLAAMQGESLVRALLRFESGLVGGFGVMLLDAPLAPEPFFRVAGTGGQLVVSATSPALRLFDAEHRDGVVIQAEPGYQRTFELELADFARAVLEGEAPVAGPEQAIADLTVVLAICRSAASGRWEKAGS